MLIGRIPFHDTQGAGFPELHSTTFGTANLITVILGVGRVDPLVDNRMECGADFFHDGAG